MIWCILQVSIALIDLIHEFVVFPVLILAEWRLELSSTSLRMVASVSVLLEPILDTTF